MSAKKSAFAAFGLLLGVALILIGDRVRTERSAHAALSALAREQADRKIEITRLQRKLADQNQHADQLRLDLKTEQSRDRSEESERLAAAATVRRKITAWADLRYAWLFRKLGFTAEQIGQFEELAIEHQLNLHDLTEAAAATGVSRWDPSILQLQKQETDRFQAAEEDLVGADINAEVQTDTRTAQLRNWVNGLAGSLYTSEPLSPDQEDSLVQILANQDPRYQHGGVASTYNDVNWPAVFTQAQAVLSPAQLATMKTNQAGYASVNEVLRLTAPSPQTNLSASSTTAAAASK